MRLGGRFAYTVNEYVAPYVGAAWEYKFGGNTVPLVEFKSRSLFLDILYHNTSFKDRGSVNNGKPPAVLRLPEAIYISNIGRSRNYNNLANATADRRNYRPAWVTAGSFPLPRAIPSARWSDRDASARGVQAVIYTAI